ncbi:phage protein Gp36 family protein [Pseudomonas pseudonitroreducens]|uniref:phage protein Gp36 family protein n=1 Tax=Pseudomonas pseudonitroreducens TaxID=2892326 RepID=UPI001F1DC9FD|nr:phage protein Gp36 family protein [Pseudomonas pseudonitroreducens]
MNLSLPSAVALLTRYGAQEIAHQAVADTDAPIDPALLLAAASGEPLDDWSPDDVATATRALARIADAATRARSEATFYLRFRSPDQAAPDWVADDLQELARYHLYDASGVKDSAVRLRYQDVIKRLEALAAEDQARGASEAGTSGLQVRSQPRLFSRDTLRRL